jgi:hypothetical protein
MTPIQPCGLRARGARRRPCRTGRQSPDRETLAGAHVPEPASSRPPTGQLACRSHAALCASFTNRFAVGAGLAHAAAGGGRA